MQWYGADGASVSVDVLPTEGIRRSQIVSQHCSYHSYHTCSSALCHFSAEMHSVLRSGDPFELATLHLTRTQPKRHAPLQCGCSQLQAGQLRSHCTMTVVLPRYTPPGTVLNLLQGIHVALPERQKNIVQHSIAFYRTKHSTRLYFYLSPPKHCVCEHLSTAQHASATLHHSSLPTQSRAATHKVRGGWSTPGMQCGV